MGYSFSNLLSQVYWHAPNLWPVAALAAIGLLSGVALFYPAQVSGLPWRWRIILPGLRCLVIVILAISLLKPIAMRLATAQERGAVVVIVDRSRSMGVVDNARTPAQLVALADAMGKLPPGVRGNASTSLAAGLERLGALSANVRSAQEDLDYARISGRDIQVRQTRLEAAGKHYGSAASDLLDKAGDLTESDEVVRQLAELARPPALTSREAWRTNVPQQIKQAASAVVDYQNAQDDRLYDQNPEVRSASDAVATLSRFKLVEHALLRRGGVVEKVRRDAAVSGFALASDVSSLPLLEGDHPVTSLDAAPDGDESNLTAGIAHAVAGKSVRAVVLFSDGRQVGGDPTLVSGLTPEGAPIFTVDAAAADAPLDLSFASIASPSSVFVGQSVTVKAYLRHDGFEGQKLQLHCRIGQEKEETRDITIHGAAPVLTEFTARMNKSGVQKIRLWFAPVPGEASADNDSAERWIKVVPDRMKVMLIAGAPTADFKELREALAQMPEVQVREVMASPPNVRLNLPIWEIASQDVIVLFDPPAGCLDERHWEAVVRAAQSGGGSVVLVAGESHLPAEYFKLPATAALLPFRPSYKPVWNVWPGEEPAFHFVPAPSAESIEMLRLRPDAESPDAEPAPRRWEQLPGCFRFLQLPEVHDEKNWKPIVRPLLVEEESRLPVLTEMRLGAGRAFFLGLKETWRWHFKPGDRNPENFWRQLIGHASEDPYFAHDGPLALDLDRVSAEPGETVHVRARIAEEISDSTPIFSLDIVRNGKVISEQALTPTGPEGSGRFAASFALGAGEYDIRWSVNIGGKRLRTVRIPLHVASTSEAEMADLSGEPSMLRKLAAASGGEFLTLEQVDRLSERLAAAGDARSRFAELSLWDSPYLFGIAVAALVAEWALRKRLGLA